MVHGTSSKPCFVDFVLGHSCRRPAVSAFFDLKAPRVWIGMGSGTLVETCRDQDLEVCHANSSLDRS